MVLLQWSSQVLICSFLWLQVVLAEQNQQEQVCITGYIMDKLCIDLGTLLDAPNIKTLENPERHSVHCLIDVPQCVNSGYEILLDPIDNEKVCTDTEGTILYNRAFSLDSVGNDEVVRVATEVGDCYTCTGSGTLKHGFQATVIGTVESNTGSDIVPPTLAVSSLVYTALSSTMDGESPCGDVPKANITACRT